MARTRIGFPVGRTSKGAAMGAPVVGACRTSARGKVLVPFGRSDARACLITGSAKTSCLSSFFLGCRRFWLTLLGSPAWIWYHVDYSAWLELPRIVVINCSSTRSCDTCFLATSTRTNYGTGTERISSASKGLAANETETGTGRIGSFF